ncbi:HeH/LEM domain-containing protein [Eikenella corrodens]|nr:HeH/LEM domain-containing protein [Eikenella corrodens]MDU1346216.1 HeH/LEM domain-containing protein [Eikenella corrodens]
MKVDELRAELTARGIKFNEKAKKDELLALLEQALAAEKEGGGDGA